MLFVVLAGTGMRIGEAAGLHVEDVDFTNCVITIRRNVWHGREQSPKTENAERVIDVDPSLMQVLRLHIGDKRENKARVFLARNGSPISGDNILKRVLHPLLEKLGIPKAGAHAFRHSRVTFLRTQDTSSHLHLQWIGHSSLETTDGYDHSSEEVDYRREMASKVGLGFVVGPNWTQLKRNPKACN